MKTSQSRMSLTCLTLLSLSPSGDKRHRAGLPAAPAAGLPLLPTRAHAGLLAEGTSQPAEVLRRGGGAR